MMKDEERMKNMHMVSECEKLDFKMYSLRDIIWFKQGLINFTLPDFLLSVENIEKNKKTDLRKWLGRFKKKI